MSPPLDSLLVRLSPQPAPDELPGRLPSPFARGVDAHPLAARAARATLDELGAPPTEGEGKMLGVLVVRTATGELGYLRGFSGMLGGRWLVPGFVPPMFDPADREPWWTDAQAELASYDSALRQLASDAELADARWRALVDAQANELAHLAADQRARRTLRHRDRARLRATAPASEAEARAIADQLHALDQESRGDKAERRRAEEAHAATRGAPAAERAAFADRRAALERLRAQRSASYQRRLFELYQVPSARGAQRPLRELFAPGEPPSGAGDCAGPKLLAYALRRGHTPLALAELWWGPPPLGGGRHHGELYPACRGKCAPLLAHMLDGLEVEPAPVFGSAPAPAQPDPSPGTTIAPRACAPSLDRAAAAGLRILYEDRWIIVIDKACGVLSVPGRSPALRDSVQTRLRAVYPDARGPLLVHRLDLDTSGILLAAKDPATHAELARRFAARELDKRYLAWLAGDVHGERGTIELALRPDLEDRPRQIHDPVHGKPALTRWRVLERRAGRTLVELSPVTGRTHQLRVHAAHERGLAAPVCGDRLYGRGDGAGDAPRLLLHAATLVLQHPHTPSRLHLYSPPPF